jgi:hypothetical protein
LRRVSTPATHAHVAPVPAEVAVTPAKSTGDGDTPV